MARRLRSTIALAAALASSIVPARAFAEHDSPLFTAAPALPRVPAPMLLPELSHPRLDFGADWFLARLSANGSQSGAMVGLFRPSVEASILAPRRIFVGLVYPIAFALPPDGGLAPNEVGTPTGKRTLFGNVEAHLRVVFPLPSSLESGLTLGVVAPTAFYDREPRSSRSASDAVATLDPTSYAQFLPGRVALRPAGDLRLMRGPFVFQARHGIDIVIDGAGEERVKVNGRLLGHAGFLVRSNVEVSLEASQIYFFSSDEKITGDMTPAKSFAERYRVSDSRRAAFTIGPSIRFSYRDADLGLALVTNVGDPMSPAASSFVGVRLSLIGHERVAP